MGIAIPAGAAKNLSKASLLKGAPPPFTGVPSSVFGKLGGIFGAIAGELLFPQGTVSEDAEQRAIRLAEQAISQGGRELIEEAPPPPFEGGQEYGVRYWVSGEYRTANTRNLSAYGGSYIRNWSSGSRGVTIPGKILGVEFSNQTGFGGFVLAVRSINNLGELKFTAVGATGTGHIIPLVDSVKDWGPGRDNYAQSGGETITTVSRSDGQPDTGGNIDSGEDVYTQSPPNFFPLSEVIEAIPSGQKIAGLSDGTSYPQGTILNKLIPKPTLNTSPLNLINSNPETEIFPQVDPTSEIFTPAVIVGDTAIPFAQKDSTNTNTKIPASLKPSELITAKEADLAQKVTTEKNPTVEDLLKEGKKLTQYPDTFLNHIDSYRTNRDLSLTNTEILDIINRDGYQDSGVKQGDISNQGSLLGTQINLQTTVRGDISQSPTKSLEDAIDLKLSDIDLIAAATATVMFNPSNTQKLENAAAAGTCQTTQSGGCMQQNILNPLQQGQSSLSDLFNSAGITGLSAQNAAIKAVVDNTNAAVRSTTYGLEAAQNFSAKAWETLRISKVLEYVNTALLLHNATMLSTNIVASLGDILSMIANNTINLIKNEDGSDIDINATIGGTIEQFLINTLGAENYQNASQTFHRTSRIVNSAANIMNTINFSLAGMAEGLETVGSYTGKIGNSLKKAGTVFENSYQWMSEKLTVKTGKIGQVQAILDGLEQVENIASDLENATSEFREVQENVTQIGNEFNKIKTEVNAQETAKTELETVSKTNSQGAQPVAADYTPDPIE